MSRSPLGKTSDLHLPFSPFPQAGFNGKKAGVGRRTWLVQGMLITHSATGLYHGYIYTAKKKKKSLFYDFN